MAANPPLPDASAEGSGNGQTPVRPTVLPPHPEGIPTELQDCPQWVGWDYRSRRGEWAKVPLDPKTGQWAKTNDPATWGTFQQALDYWQQHPQIGGIGFVFAATDPFVGVDLDGCCVYDPQSRQSHVEDWAQQLVAELSSYAELSPSGTGIKVFVKGNLPSNGKKKRLEDVPQPAGKAPAIELYASHRYFTVTGLCLPSVLGTIEERQDVLDRLWQRFFALTRAPASANGTLPEADTASLERARNARNGATFARLWAGDVSLYGGDDSRADYHLCRLLAFWTDKDPERIDRLFRQSGLYRPKWERADYRQRTIAKAIADCPEVYQPRREAAPPQPAPGGDGDSGSAGAGGALGPGDAGERGGGGRPIIVVTTEEHAVNDQAVDALARD